VVGIISSIISSLMVEWRTHTSVDDTLDVFPCHGIGGIVGMLMTGIFASKAIYPAGQDGWAYGNFEFFLTQVKAMGAAVGYSFVVSFLIFKLINFIVPLRVSDSEEEQGLDATQHNENYVQGTLLVATKKGLVEEVDADHIYESTTVNGSGYH
jgi:Amt family ammonium transporter